MIVYTIGYEGRTLENFLKQLRRARVDLLVDVREVPLSRKEGFSKKALGAAVVAAGMNYLHIPSLGCPKPIRDRYRRDHNWAAYTRAFIAHLRAQSPAVSELAEVCHGTVSALLCFEADPYLCHRTYVARAVTAISGGSVRHMGALGISADRAIGAE